VKKKRSRSRPFSIYLLKQGFNAANALYEDHNLKAVDAKELPQGACLYILDAKPKPPWWKDYFGIEEILTTESSFQSGRQFNRVD
jgi:uncharacterized protein (TIGR04141 family)